MELRMAMFKPDKFCCRLKIGACSANMASAAPAITTNAAMATISSNNVKPAAPFGRFALFY